MTYVIPLFVFNRYQDDYINIDFIQKVVFTVLLCGSLLLTYINYKNIKKEQNSKWLWTVFEILGILGIIYSVFILSAIFMFRNGIGY